MRAAWAKVGMLAAVALAAAVCSSQAQAQVLDINPTYLAQYYWNASTSNFVQCPNTSTGEPFGSTPQAVVPAGFNSALGQWTPATSCSGIGGAVTSITPGSGVSCTPNVGGTCIGPVTISLAGGSLTLQHNGTNLADQALLNFDDTAPPPPDGNVNVIFQTSSGGELSGYVPTASFGNDLAFQPIPPVAGQYVVLYPTAHALVVGGTGPCSTFGFALTGSVSAGDDSVLATTGPCGGSDFGNNWGATFSGFSLPSYVVAANVTAVYAFALSGASAGPTIYPLNLPGTVGNILLSCDAYDIAPAGNTTQLWPLQQVVSLTTIPATSISSVTCEAEFDRSLTIADTQTLNVPAIGLIVYYTGTPPPATTTVDVVPPLYLNPATNALGIDPGTLFQASSLNGYTVATLPGGGTSEGGLSVVHDGLTAADCLTGGGTFEVACVWDVTTGAYSGYPLGAGFITSLTTIGSSGAATVVDGVLNVPEYTGGGGSSGLLTVELANDASPGTTLNMMACWDTLTYAQSTIETCPAQAAYGTDTPYPFVGICIAGCGTTGFATIQYGGSVQWIMDKTVSAGGFVQPSLTVNGEGSTTCFSGPCTGVDENPQSSLGLGRVLVANSGAGTAATVGLTPLGAYANQAFNNGTAWEYGNIFPLSVGSGSNFYSWSFQQQALSTDDIPYALIVDGLFIRNTATSGRYAEFGGSTLGTSGSDYLFDTLRHGYLATGNAMLRINASSYNPATVISTAGAATTAGSSLFSPGGSTGVYQITCSANCTLATLDTDNAGHILDFDIVVNSFTWTWPSQFKNGPAISATGSASNLVSFYFDGTNYQCLSGCAASGGGGSTAPILHAVAYAASSLGTAVSSETTNSVSVSVGDFAYVFCRGATGTKTVTSSPSETWTALTGQSNSAPLGEQSAWAVIATAGAHTFTCTSPSAEIYSAAVAVDYSGTLGTVNNSTGSGSMTSPLMTSPSMSVSQRTLNIFCASGPTTGAYTITPNGGIGGVPARVTATDSGSPEAEMTVACEDSITPLGDASMIGSLNLSYGAGNQAGTMLAVNY